MAYRWRYPSDWLSERLERNPEEAKEIALALLGRLDEDAVQDLFQAEMEEDLYFEKDDETEEEEGA